jgi:hypothetical protein
MRPAFCSASTPRQVHRRLYHEHGRRLNANDRILLGPAASEPGHLDLRIQYSTIKKKVTNQTKQLTRKNGKAMKHIFTGFNLIAAFALLALAVGCASMQTQSKENLLIAAGFKVIVPHTAAQQQKLQALPAGKVTLV